MKEKIANKVKALPLYGVLHFGETQRFDDAQFSTVDNIYQYRISKIKVFLGENNRILGIQAFYKNTKGEEVPGAEGRDKSEKELDIKILEIPQNDFLCNLNIWANDDYITKLRFGTKKGKELIVGIDCGEDKIISHINGNKNNIILSLFGGYRKNLEILGLKYIDIKEYLGATIGFFQLKKMLKHEDFKKKVMDQYDQLSESDKFLFKACCLPDNTFNGIIKFALY